MIVDNSEPDGDTAAHVRGHISRLARQVCPADAFDASLEQAIAVADGLNLMSSSPERQAEWEKLEELNRIAKQRLFDGDLKGAEEAYLGAEDFRDDHERRGLLGARVTFLEWFLEADDLSRSLFFLQETDWGAPFTQVAVTRRLAEALSKAGRRTEGLDLLHNLRPIAAADDFRMTLTHLGKAFWAIGETNEGIAIFREAAQASLARAARDIQAPLWGYSSSEPIALAQIQCVVADYEGAVETLNGVMRLAVPIEYDPPRPPPSNLRPNSIYVSAGPQLKPAAKRWVSSLPDLIRVLARAGLDSEALSLVASIQTGQLKLLVEAARGQAQRGAYAEAFQTLDRIKTAALFEANEPSKIFLKPDGTMSVFQQSSQMRPVEVLERNGAVRSGLYSMRFYAARAGNAEAFRLVESLFAQYPDPHPHPGLTTSDLLPFDLLVRRGEFDQALASVETATPSRTRLTALQHVMEGIVKSSAPPRDEIWYA